MASELQVDTELLRRAAAVLDTASDRFSHGAGRHEGCPLTDDSLGRSAVAREVVGSAARRVLESIELSGQMAAASARSAERIRAVATAFAAVESILAAPR